MKIALRRLVYSSFGWALVASSLTASAQDLRLRNQPTLAAPRSTVELRTAPPLQAPPIQAPVLQAPTLSAQKRVDTETASTPVAPTPSPTASRWAPVGTSAASTPATASAPSATTHASAPVADPVSTPVVSGRTPLGLSVGTLSPTPEMWFYEQMRRDAENPEVIVRRRAEQAAAERKARIAARAWYGVSLSRPRANVTPFTYYYSPTWTPSNSHPYSWTSPRVAPPIVIEAKRPYAGLSGFGSW